MSITIYPGWLLLVGGISSLVCIIIFYSDTIKNKLFYESKFGFLVMPILSLSGLICLLLFCSSLNNYFIYEKSSPIEITEELNDENTRTTTVQIVKTKKRNLFTGAWGDESTIKTSENIIDIKYSNKIVEEVN